MKFLFIILILITSITGIAENSLDQILNLAKYRKPIYKNLNYSLDKQSNIFIPINYIKIVIIPSIFKPSTIYIRNNNQKILFKKQLINHRIHEFYIEKILSTDLNRDGKLDILIISVPPGPSGIAAEVQQVTIILSNKKSYNVLEVSSFLLGKELILDYDNDGIFEFGCIHLLSNPNKNIVFYTFNIFKFNNNTLGNISIKMKNFPKIVKGNISEGKYEIISLNLLSGKYKKNIIFDKPWDFKN